MDNFEFATKEEFKYDVSGYKPGQVATLTVLRDGETRLFTVELEEEIIHLDAKAN